MKIENNQIDELNAELTLTIEKEDYLEEYNNQLKATRQKAQMKGFRKGKTPISVVKKMYGASIMQEAVSKILTDQINGIITGDEYNIIGEPLLIDRDNLPELDYKNPQDYSYKFELGLEPEFTVTGVSDSDKYRKFKIEVEEALVDDEVASLLKRLGEQTKVDGPVLETDVVYFTGRELYNDKVLVNGHQCEFSCGADKLNDKYLAELKKLSVGGHIHADIYQLEKGMSSSHVEKYLLKVAEDADLSGMGSDFKLEIKEIVRVKEAKMDQDTFDKSFGKDNVKTEEEARAKIREFLDEHFDKESGNLVNREIMETLMSLNSLTLPEGFIRKWMSQSKEGQEMTDEQFESFKKELQWRIIKKKLVKKFEVEVKEDEIFQHFVTAIRGYSPYIDEASLKNTVYSLMNNREQVNTAVEAISSSKLFGKVKEVVKIEEEPIKKDAFYEIVKALNENAK